MIAFFSLGIYNLIGGSLPSIAYPQGIPHNIPLIVLIPLMFISGIFFGGPLAEDIGWRGYAVPELHKKTSALKAAVIVGVIWVIWHLPFFWFKEGVVVVGYVPLIWFAILTVGWAILFAWVYFNTKSLIMPVLYHSSINTTLGLFGVLNSKPSEPNTMLLLINSILTWLFITWVVCRYGSKWLVRKNKSFKKINIKTLNAA